MFNLNDEIHNTADQIKRFEKASSLVLVSLDKDNKSAEFSSSDGGVYKTTLDTCDCMDFNMRQMPCKHIYRLAIECGIINTSEYPWNEYKTYSKIYSRVKKKIDKLNVSELLALEYHLDNK